MEPVLLDPRTVDFLEDWVLAKNFKYTPEIKQHIQKVAFKLLEKIEECILSPLFGARDYNLMLTRIVICLLGLKNK